MLQILIGLLAMCLIITFELWQSNKRLIGVRIMNKILILLLIVGYGVAGTEDYNYKCQKSHEHNKKETCKVVA